MFAALLCLVCAVSAEQTYKLNEDLDIKIPCIYNNTYCDESTACNITIMDFEDIALRSDETMTRNAAYYNYSIAGADLNRTGDYSIFMACTGSSGNGFFTAIATITRNGKEPADGVFTLFIWILFIIATAGLFITLILNVAKLITAEETIYGVIMSWLFLIFILLVQYLSEYLLENLVYNMSATFLEIAIWTNGIVPGIGLIFTMIIKGIKKKRPLNINELNGRLYGR